MKIQELGQVANSVLQADVSTYPVVGASTVRLESISRRPVTSFSRAASVHQVPSLSLQRRIALSARKDIFNPRMLALELAVKPAPLVGNTRTAQQSAPFVPSENTRIKITSQAWRASSAPSENIFSQDQRHVQTAQPAGFRIEQI